MTKATVIVQSCWPYSGNKYQVWYAGKCRLETNDIDEANETMRFYNTKP